MRYDNIEYNDEWQSVPVVRAEPIAYDYDELDNEEDYDTYSGQDNDYKAFKKPDKKKTGTPQPVIKLQFMLSIAVLLLAFVLKNYGGSLYTTVSQWYFENLNNSLVVTMNTESNILPTDTSEENNQITAKQQQYEAVTEAVTAPATEAVTEISTESATTEQTQATQLSSEEATEDPTEEVEDNNEY
ncbi:MAG: hypothetical protein UD936_11640 [Acutalibacteraceae bacterium]|nr:hypothetical protein [Acutalibacteraceae bacterium]